MLPCILISDMDHVCSWFSLYFEGFLMFHMSCSWFSLYFEVFLMFDIDMCYDSFMYIEV
jgi:hypothetical protein